jgi:hypothetical protein
MTADQTSKVAMACDASPKPARSRLLTGSRHSAPPAISSQTAQTNCFIRAARTRQ